MSSINQREIPTTKLEHPHLNFFDYEKQEAVNPVNVSTVRCPVEFARPDIRLDINTINDFKYFSQMFDFFAESDFYIGDIIQWHDANYKEIR